MKHHTALELLLARMRLLTVRYLPNAHAVLGTWGTVYTKTGMEQAARILMPVAMEHYQNALPSPHAVMTSRQA